MKNKNLRCYNCGIQLTKDTKTREHIPAKNTWAGYDEEYKINRIRVDACFTCNNGYANIDSVVRDAMGVISADELQKELIEKAARSIIKQGNLKDRIQVSLDGKDVFFDFKYEDLQQIWIKDFKGVFYHNYRFPLPTNYDITAIFELDKTDEELFRMVKYIQNYVVQEDNNWCLSAHEDIFQYKIRAGVHDENGNIIDTTQIDDALIFAGVLIYYKKITAVVFAIRKDL